MKPRVLVTLLALLTLALHAVHAAEPSQEPTDAQCAMQKDQVLGPRSGNRPLPLLAGDAAHGFRPACSVPWSILSPGNRPLAVLACFRHSLLQVANDSACGHDTGMLWVSARWVVTRAQLRRSPARFAVCQQLETGTWAGTRAFSFDCVPRRKEPASAAASQDTAPHPR